MAKKHNWLLIILGIVILVVILGVAAVAGFGYYMYRQMEITTSTGGNPEQDFAALRAKFEGQMPYIELADIEGGGRAPIEADGAIHRELEKPNPAPISRLRVAAYDPRDNALVRVTIPMWLLRLAGNKPINLGDHGSGLHIGDKLKLSVTAADIERRGPGLIIDAQGRDGEKVLVWAE